MAQSLPSFADLSEKLSPAVVNISTAQTVEQPERNGPALPEGSPFEDLFRDFFEQGQPRGPRTVQSLGSGFVISPEGYVVTNNHVIEEADEITVNFADGSSLVATLVGTDTKTDISLLKVEPEKPLPFVNFGDSDAIRVGDWVLAIGNPFGLGGSVSAGIVSARNRDINAGPYDDFIQTDAAINRGNSGGPLVDMAGNVVGINSAGNDQAENIGFAIKIDFVRDTIASSIEDPLAATGYLGVSTTEITSDLRFQQGIDVETGAFVVGALADGPADDVGIGEGDVIVSIDGRAIASPEDLGVVLDGLAPGDRVSVELVEADGGTRTVEVELAARPLPVEIP